jgi:HK97 family phage major capsid protein
MSALQRVESSDAAGHLPVHVLDSDWRSFVLRGSEQQTLRSFIPMAKYSKDAQRWFRALVSDDETELRNVAQAGTQSIIYTQGASGGYLVPNEFHDSLIIGMAQVDPLLDDSAVTLVKSPSATLRPYSVPAWDLSGFTSTKVSESSQQSPQVVPTAVNKILNGYTYRSQLVASFELEQDDYQPVIDQFGKAFSIGHARGIGVDLINGNGTSAPQGVLTGATDSGITTAAGGVISADDIESIFFSLDRIYRQSPKCGWVMSDSTYRMARKAKDSNNRPLISVVDGQEILMGKRVLVSPSMPSYNPSIGSCKGIVIGDLSYFVVRVSAPVMRRTVETPAADISKAEAMYVSLIRADSKVIDPASNAILFATLHA